MRYLFLILTLFAATASGKAIPQDSLLTFEGVKALYLVLNEEVKVQHTPVPAIVEGVQQPTLSLHGDWLFAEKVKEPRDGLKSQGTVWHTLSVPSEWYMESYQVEPGKYAGYYKEFTLPSDWKQQPVLIRFGAVESECILFLNGKFVGKHIGSMTQFEMDLTPFVKWEGQNQLMLYVRSESLASQISKISHYAKHQVGGILRSVELITQPRIYIKDLYCHASLSEDLTKGLLHIDVALSEPDRKKQLEIVVKERGIEGLPLRSQEIFRQTKRITEWDTIPINTPHLWHAETPFLYTVEIALLDKGKRAEVIKQQVGFRKIEIKDNVLYVNNRPVKLRGVARHDITAYDGRAIKDTASLRRDIEQLRNANCNYIRTSHYTPDSYMLDLCDRYGIFVEDEAPVCWEAGEDSYAVTKQIFYSFKSMVLRDRMHPCILLWSLGNESDWRPKFYSGLLFAKEQTPHIPIKFSHSETHGIIKATDIGTKHYPGWKGLMAFENYYRPITFGEALHLNCYNTSENMTDPGLRDMWGDYLKYFVDFMQESPSIAGLGIWGCNDEMFYPEQNKPCGYGPWGVVDGFRREKPEFWHMKMGYSPIVITSKHFQTSGDETFVSLENRYNTLNTKWVDIYWKDGTLQGTASVDIAPGKQGTLRIPHVMKGDTLALILKDRRGFEISTWNVPREYKPYYEMPALKKGNVMVDTTDTTYIIRSRAVTYVFNRKKGELVSIQKNGKNLIETPLQVYAIPHLKENEVIDYIPQEQAGEARFSSDPLKDWVFGSESLRSTSNGVSITVHGKYGKCPIELVYRIDAEDRLRIDYILNFFSLGNKIRQIGIGFCLPKTYTTLNWKRKGLWSAYPADHIGRTQGTAKAFYPETGSDYLIKRTIPTHGFNRDGNAFGSNDFRATKSNVMESGFVSEINDTICIESNGKQHLRAWVLPDCVAFLVAQYSDSGNEFYLNYDANRTKYLDAYLAEDGDFAGWMQLRF